MFVRVLRSVVNHHHPGSARWKMAVRGASSVAPNVGKPRALSGRKIALAALLLALIVIGAWEGFEYHVYSRFAARSESAFDALQHARPSLEENPLPGNWQHHLQDAQDAQRKAEAALAAAALPGADVAKTPSPTPVAAPLPGTPGRFPRNLAERRRTRVGVWSIFISCCCHT